MLILQVTDKTCGEKVKDYEMGLKVRAEKNSVGIATESAFVWRPFHVLFVCILQQII